MLISDYEAERLKLGKCSSVGKDLVVFTMRTSSMYLFKNLSTMI